MCRETGNDGERRYLKLLQLAVRAPILHPRSRTYTCGGRLFSYIRSVAYVSVGASNPILYPAHRPWPPLHPTRETCKRERAAVSTAGCVSACVRALLVVYNIKRVTFPLGSSQKTPDKKRGVFFLLPLVPYFAHSRAPIKNAKSIHEKQISRTKSQFGQAAETGR